MPNTLIAAPVAASRAVGPTLRLHEAAGAPEIANRIARVWPAPHGGFFRLDAPRRYALCLAARSPLFDVVAAAEAESQSLRRLVDAVLPDAPAGLAEALRKLAPREWHISELVAIVSLLAENGEGAKVLRHAPEIGAGLVTCLRVLPDVLRRPRILAVVDCRELASLLADAVRCMHEVRDAAGMAKLAQRLERARSVSSLFRMVIEEIGLEVLAPPPIPPAAWMAAIASVERIRDVAMRFRNCLMGRIPMLLAGRAAYYEVLGAEPAVVEIVRDGSGLWVVGEVRGHANACITADLWQRIEAHLNAHGARTRAGGARHALADRLAQAAGFN